MRARLSTRFHFEAAHFQPGFSKDHPNGRMHGHSFTGEVVVENEVNPEIGMVVEHEELVAAVTEVTKLLDHTLLNEVPDLELPTGEYISKWIFDRLKARVAGLVEVSVIRETVGLKVTYREDFQ